MESTSQTLVEVGIQQYNPLDQNGLPGGGTNFNETRVDLVVAAASHNYGAYMNDSYEESRGWAVFESDLNNVCETNIIPL